eukprot:jgi/Astpho2/6037/Aster-x1344
MAEQPEKPPLPPFTKETALAKALLLCHSCPHVKAAENAWNTRDPSLVCMAYTPDSKWRNRSEFLEGRLMKELWCFTENRISVRFEYEWHDADGQWWRSHGNEQWQFAPNGLMERRDASINDIQIQETDRRYRWDRT